VPLAQLALSIKALPNTLAGRELAGLLPIASVRFYLVSLSRFLTLSCCAEQSPALAHLESVATPITACPDPSCNRGTRWFATNDIPQSHMMPGRGSATSDEQHRLGVVNLVYTSGRLQLQRITKQVAQWFLHESGSSANHGVMQTQTSQTNRLASSGGILMEPGHLEIPSDPRNNPNP